MDIKPYELLYTSAPYEIVYIYTLAVYIEMHIAYMRVQILNLLKIIIYECIINKLSWIPSPLIPFQGTVLKYHGMCYRVSQKKTFGCKLIVFKIVLFFCQPNMICLESMM